MAERLSASLCSKINISKRKTDWQPPLTKKNLLPESVLFKAPSFVGHSSHFCSETQTAIIKIIPESQDNFSAINHSKQKSFILQSWLGYWSHSQTTDGCVKSQVTTVHAVWPCCVKWRTATHNKAIETIQCEQMSEHLKICETCWKPGYDRTNSQQ